MKYVDTTAAEIVAGDTIIDPHSGVLCVVQDVVPPNRQGHVVLNMRGSVSLSYVGLICKATHDLRRKPRESETRNR